MLSRHIKWVSLSFGNHLYPRTPYSFQCIKYASTISVSPSSCLMDVPISTTVSGLDSKKIYTLHTTVTDQKGIPFASVAHYRSDENGTIDLNTTPSRGGHFTGVVPMGPFTHLFAQGSQNLHARAYLQDVTTPLKYQLAVYKHAVGYPLLTKGAQDLGMKPECATSHERHFLTVGCSRTPVRHGRVRGMLFVPPGEGPFPGVVDMYGSAGGLRELRSAMMAARGFAVLSLAFFAYDDLIPDLSHPLDIPYFQEAVDFLLAQDKVAKRGVGVTGISKAADVVLSLAADIPEVKVAVSINGCLCNVFAPMIYKDGSVKRGLYYDISRILIQPDGSANGIHFVNDPLEYPDTIIPLEKIKGKVLYLSSGDDKNWNSERMMRLTREYLEKHSPNWQQNWEFMACPGAGHIIEPPYMPFTQASSQRLLGGVVHWGGNPVPHGAAEVKVWHKMLKLLSQELTPSHNA